MPPHGWLGTLAALAGAASSATAASGETLAVTPVVTGTTPARLGYNLGHFMPDSNAADWFRYSGANAARIFISVSEIEPTDDLPPLGDGVTSLASFLVRRSALRADSSSTTAPLGTGFVKWSSFANNYSGTTTGSNRIQLSYALATLRDRGVSVLANLTASPNRFPISSAGDWPGKWELWQHYYAQAFLLSRDYEVGSFGMFNEPNGWEGMTEEDWLARLVICSDAIQCAVADMNTRYGRSITPVVFAPNTANGVEKYNTAGPDESTTDTWGRDAIANRHLRIDGSTSPSWMNFHCYNYQKYTTRTHPSGSLSGYITDYDGLRAAIDADMPGEPQLPMALTEFNVRTGALYDTTTQTQDSPADFAALGANCIALTSRGAQQLYLFKFGQTASTSFYGVAKNGTHYVDNSTSGENNYGAATRAAGVYRLFCKAALGGRDRMTIATSPGASPTPNGGLWSMATLDPDNGSYHLFLSNKETSPLPLTLDFSALPVAANNPVMIEEVSNRCNGGIIRRDAMENGVLNNLTMPGQSVWLLTLPRALMTEVVENAVADTVLADGTGKTLTGGGAPTLTVRADGTMNGRRAALIRLPVNTLHPAGIHSVILELTASTTSGTEPIEAHLYGIPNTWSENTATWANATGFLRQNVPSGNLIAHNVARQATSATLLGQLVVDSPAPARYRFDVTNYAKKSTDGWVSFLIVQDHRWNIAQPALTAGDVQPAGILISSRESGTLGPALVTLTTDLRPVITEPPVDTSVVEGGDALFQVTATGTEPFIYQWTCNGAPIAGATAPTLKITGATPSQAGIYQVIITNPAGSVTSPAARLVVQVPGIAPVAREATVRGGTAAATDVDEATAGYLMVKFSSSLDSARKSYFQFDLPSIADPESPATLAFSFAASFQQQVQLWGLQQAYPSFSATATWNTAAANDIASNGMISAGNPRAAAIGSSVRINPGSALAPYSFTIPRLGDHLYGNRATFVLTGVDNAANASGGLRIAPGTATLTYSRLAPDPPWTAWQKASFGTAWADESTAGPTADPDGDGINNLLEYALTAPPTVASLSWLPSATLDSGALVYRFRRDPSRTDLTLVIEGATDPRGPWSDWASSTGGQSFSALVGGVAITDSPDASGSAVSMRITENSGPTRFLRLRAVRNNP